MKNKATAVLKSKTFWGGLVYGLSKILVAFEIITPEQASAIEILGVSLGLFGARNTLTKKA